MWHLSAGCLCVELSVFLLIQYYATQNNNLDVWIWLQGTIGSLHLFVYLFDVIDATRREEEKWENCKGGQVIKFSRKKPIGGVMVHLSNVCFYVRFGRFFPVIGKVISIEKPISNPETIGSRFFFLCCRPKGAYGDVIQIKCRSVSQSTWPRKQPPFRPQPHHRVVKLWL